MLNAGEAIEPSSVITYDHAYVSDAMANGRMNTTEEALLANIQHSSKLGYPQMRTWPVRGESVCLVGSGPSLKDTLPELRRLVWGGAKLVTLNGAYQWCIDNGLKPDTQIVLDARKTNARFLEPEVPGCRYVLASQCAPETWAAVQGRPDVWIWHAVVRAEDTITAFLDGYYANHWFGVGGGTTVATRALTLLRMAGYVRFDLFGIDCCWMDNTHHAMPQPENDKDGRMVVNVGDSARPETMRTFQASEWQLKQFEDFCTVMKVNGQHFMLSVHGDGMLAYALRTLGQDPAYHPTSLGTDIHNGSTGLESL
jgi:hypothetical protein